MLLDIKQINEESFVINFGNEINIYKNILVNTFAEHILKDIVNINILNIKNCVASFNKILIQFDPINTNKNKLLKYLHSINLNNIDKIKRKNKIINIPICYDAPHSFDINELSYKNNILNEVIISEHLKTLFHVYMIGFIPGLPFLGNINFNFATPRKLSPRLEVPRGSVGIVDNLCVIYPQNTPGGWNIIGRTPIELFNKKSKNHSLLKPGYKVKFKKISIEEFNSYE